jgi:hypothetical protein
MGIRRIVVIRPESGVISSLPCKNLDDRLHHRGKLPTHSRDGVDLTLIRRMLSLTPAQRLQVLEQNIRSIDKMRHAARGK